MPLVDIIVLDVFFAIAALSELGTQLVAQRRVTLGGAIFHLGRKLDFRRHCGIRGLFFFGPGTRSDIFGTLFFASSNLFADLVDVVVVEQAEHFREPLHSISECRNLAFNK